jgi:Protein of unknown function (DUF3987)
VLLEDPCLSVFLVTPSRLSELFATPRLCEAGLLPRFCVVNPHCLPSKIAVDTGAEAKTLPSKASQPYEAAIFACFERYRLELNDEPMVIDMEREARKLVIHYFNALVDVPNRGSFEARVAEQAIKFALIYHVFSRIEIEQRSAGTYGVKELEEELPPLGRPRWRPDLASRNGSRSARMNTFRRSERRTKKMFTIGSTSGSRSFLILRSGNSIPRISGFRRRLRRENTSGTGRIAGFWSKSRANRVGRRAGGNFLGIGLLRLAGAGSHEQKGNQEALNSPAITEG